LERQRCEEDVYDLVSVARVFTTQRHPLSPERDGRFRLVIHIASFIPLQLQFPKTCNKLNLHIFFSFTISCYDIDFLFIWRSSPF
jgi:hypothetical protein